MTFTQTVCKPTTNPIFSIKSAVATFALKKRKYEKGTKKRKAYGVGCATVVSLGNGAGTERAEREGVLRIAGHKRCVVLPLGAAAQGK
jgi:hypothetical protein